LISKPRQNTGGEKPFARLEAFQRCRVPEAKPPFCRLPFQAGREVTASYPKASKFEPAISGADPATFRRGGSTIEPW
jgi:hypothetical protein